MFFMFLLFLLSVTFPLTLTVVFSGDDHFFRAQFLVFHIVRDCKVPS